MNRHRLSRPSLKITRHVDETQDSQFIIEVWNPFVSAYQAAGSVEDGLKRVGELADLISRMWLHRHPKRDVLVDIPEAAAGDGTRWAEFRINATAFRSYDTRDDARPAWARVGGMTQAAAMTCTRIGHALPPSTVS